MNKEYITDNPTIKFKSVNRIIKYLLSIHTLLCFFAIHFWNYSTPLGRYRYCYHCDTIEKISYTGATEDEMVVSWQRLTLEEFNNDCKSKIDLG